MIYYVLWGYFFFFKQKTAYEMRISDWSSDVCSSDLGGAVFCDFAFIGFPHTDDAARLAARRPDQNHASAIQHAKRDEARFSVVGALIAPRHHRAGEHPPRISEYQPANGMAARRESVCQSV